MAAWATLVRITMKDMRFGERYELPRPINTDLAASLGDHGHEDRLPREAHAC